MTTPGEHWVTLDKRLLGRKQMEVEILQAAQEVVKKSPWLRKGSAK